MPPQAKGKKPLPKTIAGLPTPVVIVVGVAGVAYLYLRHSAAASGVQAAGTGGSGGSGRGPAGRRGARGRPGHTIRKVVLICPPGYRKVGRRCVPHHRRRHPAHRHLQRQGG